jgi:zinc transport system ATP-binding protein
MDTPAIQLTNVSFAYGDAPVLEDVTLALGVSELVAVVGPNGGGKTTLLKLALGLLAPDAGTVSVFGQPARSGRRRIGYMPQHLQCDAQFPVSVLDVVLMGRLDRLRGGFYRAADRAQAREALAEFGLADAAERPFASLSGGQRQRALIARALAGEPDLLLLDEPTSSIDLESEHRLRDTLTRLNRRMAIVMVSHDLGFVSDIVRSVVCVNRRVVVHPTSQLTGEAISELYGADMRLVRHDHRCAEAGHEGGPR